MKKIFLYLLAFLLSSIVVPAAPTVQELEKRVRTLEEKAETLREKDPDIVLINGIMWKSRQPEEPFKSYLAG